MIRLRFELLLTDEGWIAQAHCDCGSTFASEPRTESGIMLAIDNVRGSLADHLIVSGDFLGACNKCGTKSHAAIQCQCDDCQGHDRKLGAMVAETKRMLRRGGR